MKYVNQFLKLTLVKKFFFCFFIFGAFAAVLSAAWFGMCVMLGLAFLILQLGSYSDINDTNSTGYQINENLYTDEDENDAYISRVAEEQRLAEESRIIQEDLDRL